MKPHVENHIAHHGTINGSNRRAMSLDESSLVHLLNVLTDIYSDPMLAAIREPATNAWDSHKAAGNTAPVEITLPSDFNPTYTVKDHGLGMSVDFVLNLFSKYGASTKRDNDDESGMLGLGCKAALTYVSQFTVVTIKDGVKASVLVSRGEDGVGGVEVVDTCGTDEPNGVEVHTPVKDVRGFVERAQRFFAYWEEGSVLVNGESPSKWLPEGVLRVSDDVWITPNYADSRIVQGNIAYPLDYSHSLSDDFGVIVRVPVGSVAFTPNREALYYSAATERVIKDVQDYVKQYSDEALQRWIDAAATPAEAAERLIPWRKRYYRRTFTYRGRTVPSAVKFRQGWIYSPAQGIARKQEAVGISEAREKVTFVLGHPTLTLTQKQRKQIKIYLRDNVVSGRLQFVPETVLPDWIAGAPTLPWEKIDAIELPKAARRSGGSGVRVEVYEPAIGGWRERLRDLLSDDTLFVPVTRWQQAFVKELLNQGLVSASKYVFVRVPDRSLNKFIRENDTVSFSTVINKAATAFVATLNDDEVALLNVDQVPSLNHRIRHDSGIDDPELVTALWRLSGSDVTAAQSKWTTLKNAVSTCHDLALPLLPSSDWDPQEIADRYPLVFLESYYIRNFSTEDLVEYVNALYAYRNNEEN